MTFQIELGYFGVYRLWYNSEADEYLGTRDDILQAVCDLIDDEYDFGTCDTITLVRDALQLGAGEITKEFAG